MRSHRLLVSCTLRFLVSSVPRFAGSLFLWLSVSLFLRTLPAHAGPIDQTPERICSVPEIARAVGLPATLTLHLHNVSQRQVFEVIAAQSDVRFVIHGEDTSKVSVDCDHRPFWTAIRTVLEQIGWVIDSGGPEQFLHPIGDWEMDAQPTRFLSGPKMAAGPFIVEMTAREFSQTRSGTLEQLLPETGGEFGSGAIPRPPLAFSGRLLCDPKLRILGGTVKIVGAGDNTGTSLLPNVYENFPCNFWPDNSNDQRIAAFTFFLNEPAKGAKLLKSLRGNIAVDTALHTEKWELPNILKLGSVTKIFGPPGERSTITLTAKPSSTGMDISIAILGDKRTHDECLNMIQNDLCWFDARGKPIEYDYSGMTQDGDEQRYIHNITYTLGPNEPPIAEPITIVAQVPTQIRTVDIPFQFSNLPLP